ARGEIGQRPFEEARDAALALAEQLARERVRVDLDEEQAAQLPRGLIGEPARQRRLPRARRPGEDDETVDRKPHRIETAAMAQREEREVEEALLEPVGRHDARPTALPGRIRQLDE